MTEHAPGSPTTDLPVLDRRWAVDSAMGALVGALVMASVHVGLVAGVVVSGDWRLAPLALVSFLTLLCYERAVVPSAVAVLAVVQVPPFPTLLTWALSVQAALIQRWRPALNERLRDLLHPVGVWLRSGGPR